MSGDPEQEYFADGITEDIITNLSLWRTFPVISRNSSFTFRGKSQNLKQVANELGARYIVEGSVRKGGNRVRITAQLIDAEEDHHLWSEKWDRTLEDIFDVQDEVSETIARRVAPSVRGHEQNRLTRKRPENLSAWEEHLQGLQCYHERQRKDYEDLGLAQARQHFEKAIELDPTLSDAHSYLAFCGIWEIIQRITKDSKQTLNSVLASARQAQVLNPENPVALGVMACYYLFLGDQAIARDFAKKAIGFNPSYAPNYFFLAAIQAHYGEFQEAESSALKTIELSPVDPELGEFFIPLSYSYLGQCKYEEALEAVEKTLQQYPENGFSLGTRAAILGHLERGSEGKIALDRYLALRPNLNTRADFRSSFTPNSVLADPMIEGLIKAGWKPED
jgi:TolB-like protein/Tfp pilus assembly protein PilF